MTSIIKILLIITLFSYYNDALCQLTTTPNSIYLGYEGGEIEDDTLFVWDKVRGHLRSGRFDAASSNFIDVGYFSQSFGDRNIASGESSFAVNKENTASGIGSAAFGSSNHAAAGYSALFGIGNQSLLFFETIVGKHNRIATLNGAVPLFTVGNGGSVGSRANAFIVTDESFVGIGDIDPEATLHILHDNATNGTAGLRIENVEGPHWRFFAGTVGVDKLALFHHSLIGTPVGVFDASGNYGSPSDARLKNSISEISYGLEIIMQLRPVSYHFNHIKTGQKNLGYIAQEVKEIIPEAVNYNAEDDQYQLYYDSFNPVAIKAIQELNAIVQKLKREVETLKKEVDKISSTNGSDLRTE